MSWNPDLHPRDGDTGRFTENWKARLADQLARASSRRTGTGRTSHGTQVDSWMHKVNSRIGQKGSGRG